MPDFKSSQQALLSRILTGDGCTSPAQRRRAFDNAELGEPLRTLINKVAKRADSVTDEDVAAVRRSGLSEDHVFEVVVCAAIGQATLQYNAALVALDEAEKE